MNLDALSVAAVFVAAAEAAVGVVAMAAGIAEARRPAGDGATRRRPLLALAAGTLVVLAAAAFPLLYLLQADLVPRWPGVICIEGVRRIGAGTAGPARLLPGLLEALDWTRLALVFASGAWVVLHRLAGAGAGGARRAALAAAALGLLAVADGGLTGAYILVPKEEIPAATGCCTSGSRAADRETGLSAGGPREGRSDRVLALGYLAAAGAMGAGAGLARRRRGPVVPVLLALGAAGSLPLAGRFLVDVASPVALGLPYHHCAWCAFAGAPETVAGALLHLGAVFAAGWAALASLAGGGTEATALRGRLLGAAGFGFLAAGAMAGAIVLGS